MHKHVTVATCEMNTSLLITKRTYRTELDWIITSRRADAQSKLRATMNRQRTRECECMQKLEQYQLEMNVRLKKVEMNLDELLRLHLVNGSNC